MFVHLNLHTEYSIVDGLIKIKPLVRKAAQLGMPAIAMTDRMNLFGAVKFYRAAIAAGVKPILGAEILLSNPTDVQQPYRLTLLCQNQQGYKNLMRLISRAYTEGRDAALPCIELESLTLESADGLLALSGAINGDIGCAILSDQLALAEEKLIHWSNIFSNRYYLELQRTGAAQETVYIKAALELAHRYQLPVVATNAVRFMSAEDFVAHEARVCIHEGSLLADAQRPRRYQEQQYLRSPEEMKTLFADIPEALLNSVEIAKRCNVILELGKSYLPDFPVPEGLTMAEYFTQQAQQGLSVRLERNKHTSFLLENEAEYQIRLQLEIDVINAMGFAGYFLIVADFIRWARENDVPVGPGRGSGAGSLVAYALKITDLDPIQHQLLFERFLNPERVSMPDFDIDFCMEGRDRVIEYVANKYGRTCVSQIITFGTMAAKAVVRDVGRVLGFPYGFVDKIAKMIPFELGMTLEKALAQEEVLRQSYENEDDVRSLLDLAKKLEGIARNVGKHAGGVVIAPTVLTDFTPLYCEPGGQHLVSQFDKDDVEAVGLVKFDFLGLRTLTQIERAIQKINVSQPAPIHIHTIPMDDAATFELLKACHTTAIFQLESRGMKELVKRLQPDSFEEIVALVALYRPGPLQSGMVDDFINRKHGRAPIEYLHPELEPILKSTYGVILYQEQVMQIAQTLAGYTLGGADLLRRAMGKKKAEEMAEQRTIFLQGTAQRGIDTTIANAIFDLMEKFAGYGFNRSHSAAYALLSYQTAWLKTHYPAHFMAAVLTTEMGDTDQIVVLIDECRARGLTVLPPNINESAYDFTVNAQGEIIYGLGAIKGIGQAIESCLIARQSSPFKNLYDFCQRIDLQKMNRRIFEALIRSGSLDGFDQHRASLMKNLDPALRWAEKISQNQRLGQYDLFAELEDTIPQTPEIGDDDIAPWPDHIRLQGEKDSLGFYLTGHPVDQYRAELKQLVTHAITDLEPGRKQIVTVAGLIAGIRTRLTQRGDKIAFMNIEDQRHRLDVAVFTEAYKNYHAVLVKDQMVIVEGEISMDTYTDNLRMTANKIFTLQQAREKMAKYLLLNIAADRIDDALIEQLKKLLGQYGANGQYLQNSQFAIPVYIDYVGPEIRARVEFSSRWKVYIVDELLAQLDKLLGPGVAKVVYQ